jgi:rfaE bifunctional protein nucleotidyltransferase chain/domain
MISGIYSLSELQQAIALNPDQWRPLVLTNGCFDLLHAGQVRYIHVAKSLGRAIVVGLNSDRSVKTIKPNKPGLPPRPLVPQTQRAEVLASLKAVDGVVIFKETTATRLIQAVQPEIYVKGGDYSQSTLPEFPVVQAYGGQIELVKFEVQTSTTALIESILNAQGFCDRSEG